MGPLGKSAEDLEIAMRIFCDTNMHLMDPMTAPMPWNDKHFQSISKPTGIKVGMMTLDPFMPVTKSVKRALSITEKALKDMGYELVPF